jgi:exo-beta-1,3-glucanase (GH17 family)
MILGLAVLPMAESALSAARLPVARRLGVCARIQDTSSGYRDIDRMVSMLHYLGLDTIRCGAIQYAGANSWGNIEKAAKLGVKMSMTVRAGRSPADNVNDIEHFVTKFPGAVIGIEGPNEIDHSPVHFQGMIDQKTSAASTPVAALAYQAELTRLVQSSKVLRMIPVINFSDFAQSQQTGVFNTHPYPRKGAMLSRAIPGILTHTTGPIAITETGAPSAPDGRFYPTATEDTQSRFVVDAIEALAAEPRIARMYLYQLMDNYPAPADPTKDGMEFHFGLFRNDGTPKPAAEAARRVIRG